MRKMSLGNFEGVKKVQSQKDTYVICSEYKKGPIVGCSLIGFNCRYSTPTTILLALYHFCTETSIPETVTPPAALAGGV